MKKLTSRKFWLSIAAFLGSIGMSISGLVTNEKWIVVAGTVCAMLSAAIYAAVEAYCDANCVDVSDSYITKATEGTYLANVKRQDADGSTQTYTFKENTTASVEPSTEK